MMKKITLLMLLLVGLTLNAQIYFEDFESDAMDATPANMTVLNEDACTINNPTLFVNSTWTIKSDADAQGQFASTQSWTVPSCQVDDWMITPSIDLTAAVAGTSLSWLGKSAEAPNFPETYEVLISTSGTATTDFTVLLTVVGELENWTEHSVDLSSYIGGTVFIAFRLTSFDMSRGWIDDILVEGPLMDDLEIISIDFSEDAYQISYLTTVLDYVSFCPADSQQVSITVKNNGLNAITSFSASFDNASTMATETFTIPSLATDESTQVTFITYANTDTFGGYYMSASVDYLNDERPLNDSLIQTVLMVTAAADTVVDGTNFFTSFEQWPAGPDDLGGAWWTSENSNNDAAEFSVVYWGAGENASDGEFSLFVAGDNATSSDGGDDWAFSPCMYFEDSKAYLISFRTKMGIIGAEERIELHLCSDNNSSSTIQSIGTVMTGDTMFSDVQTATFIPDATGMVNIGLHKNTVGQSWFLMIDEFSIEILEAPTAPTVANTWNACDNEATLNFSYVLGNTYSVDWGDGSSEIVTNGVPVHTYAAGSTYNVVVTVTNILETVGLTGNTSVNAAALSAPTALFSYIQASTSDNSVEFSSTSTLECYTYDWNFGDNSAHATTANADHTYIANGEYDVTLLVGNGVDESFTLQTVTITGIGINEIDFVNGIKIFPNPVKDVLNINFNLSNTQDIEISLISIDGKIVNKSFENTSSINKTINTSALATGVYILNITTDEGVYTRNIMVK